MSFNYTYYRETSNPEKKMLYVLLSFILLISSAFVAKHALFTESDTVLTTECMEIKFPKQLAVESESLIELKKDGQLYTPEWVSWMVLGNSKGMVLIEEGNISSKNQPMIRATKPGNVNILATVKDTNAADLCGLNILRQVISLEVTSKSSYNLSPNN